MRIIIVITVKMLMKFQKGVKIKRKIGTTSMKSTVVFSKTVVISNEFHATKKLDF